jgi:L-amino acid N-acyltransferase YncA
MNIEAKMQAAATLTAAKMAAEAVPREDDGRQLVAHALAESLMEIDAALALYSEAVKLHPKAQGRGWRIDSDMLSRI